MEIRRTSLRQPCYRRTSLGAVSVEHRLAYFASNIALSMGQSSVELPFVEGPGTLVFCQTLSLCVIFHRLICVRICDARRTIETRECDGQTFWACGALMADLSSDIGTVGQKGPAWRRVITSIAVLGMYLLYHKEYALIRGTLASALLLLVF